MLWVWPSKATNKQTNPGSQGPLGHNGLMPLWEAGGELGVYAFVMSLGYFACVVWGRITKTIHSLVAGWGVFWGLRVRVGAWTVRRVSLGSGTLGSSPKLHPAPSVTWDERQSPLDLKLTICKTGGVADGPIRCCETKMLSWAWPLPEPRLSPP